MIEQKVINDTAVRKFCLAIQEMKKHEYSVKKFRNCTAEVITTENWYILRSYNTLVACINRNDGNCYDVLRYVYGYTSTSCQHIRKFFNDYQVSFNYPHKEYRYK